MRLSHSMHPPPVNSHHAVDCFFVFDIQFEYLPPRSANFAHPELMHYETLGQLNDPCPSFTGATRYHTLFDCCVIAFGAGGCPWMICGHLKSPRRVRFWMRKGMETGSLAMIRDSIVILQAAPFANSRIKVGYKRLDEEVVVQYSNNGKMSENLPNFSIIICGRGGVVWAAPR